MPLHERSSEAAVAHAKNLSDELPLDGSGGCRYALTIGLSAHVTRVAGRHDGPSTRAHSTMMGVDSGCSNHSPGSFGLGRNGKMSTHSSSSSRSPPTCTVSSTSPTKAQTGSCGGGLGGGGLGGGLGGALGGGGLGGGFGSESRPVGELAASAASVASVATSHIPESEEISKRVLPSQRYIGGMQRTCSFGVTT